MSNPPSPTADAVTVTVASVTIASSDPPLPPPRKFPAPCWTQEETMALINAYKDKWYALRCRNLRSADWDSVAADLFTRCPPSAPPSNPSSTAVAKTSAQCRHKMEKLRKRYRTEKQRALAHPNRFFASSWIFFDLMDSMETGSCSNGGSGPNLKGFALKAAKKDASDEKGFDLGKFDPKFKHNFAGSEDNSPGDLSAVPIKFKFKSHASSLGFDDASRFDRHLDAEEEQRYGGYDSRSSGFFERKIGGRGGDDGGGGGYYDSRFESRIPNGVPGAGISRKNRAAAGNKRGGMMMMEDHVQDVQQQNTDPNSVVSEMVKSIRMMGEGFVKMEKMKVDMVREIERMRMEMEMKRSEMILESQQLIVNAFVEGLLGVGGSGSRKKSKKVKLVD